MRSGAAKEHSAESKGFSEEYELRKKKQVLAITQLCKIVALRDSNTRLSFFTNTVKAFLKF